MGYGFKPSVDVWFSPPGWNFIGILGMILLLGFLGVFIFILVKRLNRWNRNNRSPVLTVGARVVAKRSDYQKGTGDSVGYTTYYATFQVESGDSMELCIPDDQYGYLIEGASGKLMFQGTRFLKFTRQ